MDSEDLKNEESVLFQMNEEEIMKLTSSEATYLFKFEKEGDKVHFAVKESEVYAPFTFEESFTLKEFIERHKGFKACDNVDEVIRHLKSLYKKKKIKIEKLGPSSDRYLFIWAWDISKEFESALFDLKQKMTDDKDKALLDLYNIQKEQMKLLKEIQSIAKNNLTKENPLNKEIEELLKEKDEEEEKE